MLLWAHTTNKNNAFTRFFLVAVYCRFTTNIHSKWFVRITGTILIYCHFWLWYITSLVQHRPRTLKSSVVSVFPWWINNKSHADSDQYTVMWQDFNASWTNKRYSTDNWVFIYGTHLQSKLWWIHQRKSLRKICENVVPCRQQLADGSEFYAFTGLNTECTFNSITAQSTLNK